MRSVILVAGSGPANGAGERGSPTTPAPCRPPRLLYVDDDPCLLELARVVLSREGFFEVMLASSGPEAVAAAMRSLPDIALLDVMMPGLDGPATLVALRAHGELAGLPMVFLTARVIDDEVRYLRQLGPPMSSPSRSIRSAFRLKCSPS